MSDSTASIDFRRLTVAERFLLIDEIWDSIVTENGTVPLTEAQRNELDRRLAEAEQDPGDVVSWETLKRRLLESK